MLIAGVPSDCVCPHFTARYASLAKAIAGEGPGSLSAQGYDEVPTLGIKLYRIWPGSGLKPHLGSPGRIVSSMALHAPEGSSLTVAGSSKPWVEGEMHHFDDSFVHHVDNPHPTEFRVVLALITWHPDLFGGGVVDVGSSSGRTNKAEL